jgi:hypothetical protein
MKVLDQAEKGISGAAQILSPLTTRIRYSLSCITTFQIGLNIQYLSLFLNVARQSSTYQV